MERRYVILEVVSSSLAPVHFSLFKPKLFKLTLSVSVVVYYLINKVFLRRRPIVFDCDSSVQREKSITCRRHCQAFTTFRMQLLAFKSDYLLQGDRQP